MSNNAPDYENNLAFDPDINTMPRCDIEALKSEIKRLKELLKECLDVFSNHVSPFYSYCQWQRYPCVDTEDFYQDTKAVCKIIDKIDNAIGEKR